MVANIQIPPTRALQKLEVAKDRLCDSDGEEEDSEDYSSDEESLTSDSEILAFYGLGPSAKHPR